MHMSVVRLSVLQRRDRAGGIVRRPAQMQLAERPAQMQLAERLRYGCRRHHRTGKMSMRGEILVCHLPQSRRMLNMPQYKLVAKGEDQVSLQ